MECDAAQSSNGGLLASQLLNESKPVDIDADDNSDPLACPVYVEQIMDNLFRSEVITLHPANSIFSES
jgi:hypothetical protein